MTDAPAAVMLTSSWRIYLTGIVSPLIVIGIAAAGTVVAGGLAVVPVILFVLGILIAAVSLLDTPRTTTIDADGIRRKCMLRTHHLAWHDVDAIARGPALTKARGRDANGNASATRQPGGLTAAAGRRRHLLADVAEDPYEFELLQRGMKTWCPDVFLRANPPHV